VVLWVVGALVAAGLVVAGTIVALGGDDSDSPVVDAPDDWDPRVVDIVAFVEQTRQLDFEHPVAVTFLTEDEFVARVTESSEPTDAERESIEANTDALRALGLIEGDVDLIAESEELAGEGVLGFYDPETEEMVVRGDELTPYVRSVLAHELTHALQDQHFDLDTYADPDATSGESTGYRSLVEADASWVEDEYVATLDGDDLQEYQDEAFDRFQGADYSDIPDVLVQSVQFPYTFGPVLHDALLADGGVERVDEAFDDPPSSDEQVMFPDTYLDRDDPIPVDLPEVDDGDDVLFEGDFGAFTLFLMLGSRLDFAPSLAAVDGWGGDAFRIVDRDDTTCVRLDIAMDTDADLDELEQALGEWAEGLDAVTVERDGDHVHVGSCDEGGTLPPSTRRTESAPAADVLAYRAVLIDELAGSFGGDEAVCITDGIIEQLGPDRVVEVFETFNDDPDADVGDLQDAVGEAALAC
jgi:hypothetical protein